MRKIANSPTVSAHGGLALVTDVAKILRLKKTDDSSRSEHLVQVTNSALQNIPAELNTNDVTASGELNLSLKIPGL